MAQKVIIMKGDNMKFLKKRKTLSKRGERLQRQFKRPTTQNTLKFERLEEDGHMIIGPDRYSHTYRLGELSYITASDEDKDMIIDTYADAIGLLEANANFQLLVINKRISTDKVVNVKYPLENDANDMFREEYNTMIQKRFDSNAKAFEISRYLTIATEGFDTNHARRQFHDLSVQLEEQFKKINVTISHLSGVERLNLFSELLRETTDFPYDYEDIEASGIGEKSFIAPNHIKINEKYLEIDDKFTKVKYIRHFPKTMSDKLIYELTSLGIEFAIVLNATVYDDYVILEELKEAETDAGIAIIRANKKSLERGIILPDDYIGGDKDKATEKSAKQFRNEIQEFDQKIFKGMVAVFLKADTLEKLNEMESMIARAGSKLGVKFEDIYYYQEEALNSVLPIGECFVDVKQKITRRMTTSNIATQVPFIHSDLISDSPNARYYGQNQLSHNMITIDRKKDLNTGSGVILGSSGSGKSVTVKSNEIIPTLLRYPEDKVIVIDPEAEYRDVAMPFDAQVIDVEIGSQTHINLLDLPDLDKLEALEAKDPIGDKANFLLAVFETLLDEVSSAERSLIDRVTKETYEHYEKPTLKEWHRVLESHQSPTAMTFAEKVALYTIGSQSIFSHPTNVDLNKRFVIFNLKNLSNSLKPFALTVIQDFVWHEVVANKGKCTIWLYFDELQLYFRSYEQAKFFMELYSRIRKYGAIPTGITQNVETIAAIEEGRKLLSNSEFIILLKQKPQDIKVLREVIRLTDKQEDYLLNPKQKGSGLICAGDIIVPFENPIPKKSKLFELIKTDA